MPSVARSVTRRVQSFFGGIGRAVRGLFGRVRGATRRRRGLASAANRTVVNRGTISNTVAASAATAAAAATTAAAASRPRSPRSSARNANIAARASRIAKAASRRTRRSPSPRAAEPRPANPVAALNKGIAMPGTTRRVIPSRAAVRYSANRPPKPPSRSVPPAVKALPPPINVKSITGLSLNQLKGLTNAEMENVMYELSPRRQKIVRNALGPENARLFPNLR